MMGFISHILPVYIGITDASIVKYLTFCWSHLVGNFFLKNADLSTFLLLSVTKAVVLWWNSCSGDLKGIHTLDRINVFLFNLLSFNLKPCTYMQMTVLVYLLLSNDLTKAWQGPMIPKWKNPHIALAALTDEN